MQTSVFRSPRRSRVATLPARALGIIALLLGFVGASSWRLGGVQAQTPVAISLLPPAINDLNSKRAQLATQISKLTGDRNAEAETPRSASEEVEQELELLRALDLLYLQHQSLLEHRLELEQEKKTYQEQLETLQKFGPDEPKPWSFWLLEDTRDQLSAEEDKHDSSEADIAAARQMLEQAREDFEDAERERRQASEAHAEADADSDQQKKLGRKLQLAELESRLAQETVALRRVELEAKTSRQELCKLLQEVLSAKIERIEKDVRFTERDFQSRLTDLMKTRDDLKQKLRAAERRLQQLETQRSATVAELGEAGADRAAVTTVNDAYQVARRVCHEEITLLHQRLGEIEHYKRFLNARYEVAVGSAQPADIKQWRSDLDSLRERLQQAERSLGLRLDEIRADQATLYRRAQMLDEQDATGKQWLTFQTEHLHRLAEMSEAGLVQLKSGRRMLRRFADDLDDVAQTDRGPSWVEQARESVSAVWQYEIASVDDRPITVSKIVSGLFYLLVGVVLARLLSRLIGSRLLPKFGINEGATHAAQSITFYSLCVVFSLISLELVNMPFAAFTFLGGAVAIGLGFGSQNILNNFISGLILLAEQPIRVGDLVEIDGVCGTVEEIGARSTRVKTVSNHELIVPNSKLLENKVTNLTLSDNLVQTAIGITLSPSLSVEEARRKLKGAALSHPQVLHSPAPVVLFKEFSATSMSFELHFWIKLSSVMACRVVESDVREAINVAFLHTDAATTAVKTTTATAALSHDPVSAADTVPKPHSRSAERRSA